MMVPVSGLPYLLALAAATFFGLGALAGWFSRGALDRSTIAQLQRELSGRASRQRKSSARQLKSDNLGDTATWQDKLKSNLPEDPQDGARR